MLLLCCCHTPQTPRQQRRAGQPMQPGVACVSAVCVHSVAGLRQTRRCRRSRRCASCVVLRGEGRGANRGQHAVEGRSWLQRSNRHHCHTAAAGKAVRHHGRSLDCPAARAHRRVHSHTHEQQPGHSQAPKPPPITLLPACLPAHCTQVILLTDIDKLGGQGELLTVPIGFWRNYLQPQNKAKIASAEILE